jgi:hypothetical protein
MICTYGRSMVSPSCEKLRGREYDLRRCGGIILSAVCAECRQERVAKWITLNRVRRTRS